MIALAWASLALVVVLGACSNERSSPPPTTPLADALADIGGGGGAEGSLGVGWADPQLVEADEMSERVIVDALGPNAGSVVEATPHLRRRFGLDPLTAERLVSVGGSFAFGLRLDEVDGRRLRRALVAAGGRSRRAGQLDLVEIGDYAVVPELLLRLGVRGFGAFDAFGRDLTVLAISETARAALLGRGGRLLDEPTYRAAADCLGDVVAARMIPDKLLLSTELGVDLVAVGTAADHDVLCVMGGTAERSDEVASNLETSLAPGAPNPDDGEALSESVAAVQVTSGPYEDVEVVRAEVTLARGEPPGFLFGTISLGSVFALIDGSPRTFGR